MRIPFLDGMKTHIVSATGVLLGVLELLGFDVVPGVTPDNAVQLILSSLGFSTLRSGVASLKKDG